MAYSIQDLGAKLQADPRAAMNEYAYGGGGQWFQQNQKAITDQLFGGDQGKFANWMGGGTYGYMPSGGLSGASGGDWANAGQTAAASDPMKQMQGGNYAALLKAMGIGGAAGGDPLANTNGVGESGTAGTGNRNNFMGTEMGGGVGGFNAPTAATGSLATTGTPTGPTGGTPSPAAGTTAPTTTLAQTAANPNSLNIDAFLDPSMQFRINQGSKALQGGAAARGGLLSGATLKALQDYGQETASQEYGNAFNRAFQDRGYNRDVFTGDRAFDWAQQTNNRDFAYNAGRDDRNFNYNANRDDRTFNNEQQRFLATLGMSGLNSQGDLAKVLSALLSSNTLGAGNAAAGGSLGGGNALNAMITQMLQQLQGA